MIAIKRQKYSPITGLAALVLSLLVVHSVVPIQSRAAQVNDKSCRQHPQLVGKCFTVHGRLSVYNGAPAMRIWRIGTKRMLGVSEQRFAVQGYRNVPETIQNQLNQDVDIFGDFLVCPFTRPKAGEMQMVCIEEGKNLKVQKRAGGP
ncbi:MAG TPA: hypothetical protein VLN44_06410 [Pyrinomonadaceae bacterium]|nr:hypothetical protein [Pyrinomonadaceae bacterium]